MTRFHAKDRLLAGSTGSLVLCGEGYHCIPRSGVVSSPAVFFDNIAYSELAEFFLPWLELLKIVNDPEARQRVALESLVGQRDDVEATERYTMGLQDAFREIARVLKPYGLVVLSFRHTVPVAWYALARAMASAPLHASCVLPTPGEAESNSKELRDNGG
jgi:putative DNA methylase